MHLARFISQKFDSIGMLQPLAEGLQHSGQNLLVHSELQVPLELPHNLQRALADLVVEALALLLVLQALLDSLLQRIIQREIAHLVVEHLARQVPPTMPGQNQR